MLVAFSFAAGLLSLNPEMLQPPPCASEGGHSLRHLACIEGTGDSQQPTSLNSKP